MFRFSPRASSVRTPLPVPDAEPVETVAEDGDAAPIKEDGASEEREDYQAFFAVPDNRQVEALWLRCAGEQEDVMLDYAWRRFVRYDGRGCALTLVFADATVRILGRNLGELMKKLQNRKVEWVQMHDPASGPEPLPEEPVVTAIVVEFAAEKEKQKTPALRLLESA